nr:unnamed protein product [Callosobruchus analis]
MIKGFTLYRVQLLTTVYTMWVVVIIVLCEKSSVSAALLVHKYSTRIVRTRYGPLRGIMIHIHPPVEAFLGVPYATPPVGSLRYIYLHIHLSSYLRSIEIEY